MLQFVDSSAGPTLAQARTALAQGVQGWAFYRAGPKAFHNWTDGEVAVLAEAGVTLALPIFVPDLSLDPVAAASSFVASYQSVGWSGAGALDTEAYMRGDARLRPFVDAFTATMDRLGQASPVYAGGDYWGANPPWLIWPAQAPAGQARQTGQATIDGLAVDTDNAGDGFPFARLATGGDDVDAWGSDTATEPDRIADYRRAMVRQWFRYYQGGEPTAAAQAGAVAYWAQHGGDLTIAGIIDGSIRRA